ncbi:MAG: cysteine desulfurase [Chloracidobacterium sp.]|nr:cysteine desulfurase [Chloracidobacterium sp.]MDW8216178.1 cysteine desulfurase family protein [Acidobacteriota bacterium]
MSAAPPIYLDNAATTRVLPEVAAALLPYLTEQFGNASSIHAFGQRARAAVEQARRQTAALIGAEPSEITFLSGGTEANNLAIQGVVGAYGSDRRRHIITTAFEHPAVLAPCRALEAAGWRVTYLPVGAAGRVTPDDVAAALTDDTLLVTVMLANNEVGTLQPVADIGALVAERRRRGQVIFLHTDAVQAVGKIPVNVHELRVDLLSISGHKMHAPKGVGALYVAKHVRLAAQQLGGHQERDRRAGTEAVANIVALGRAAQLAAERLDHMDAVRALRDELERELQKRIPNMVVNGVASPRLPHITNLAFDGLDANRLVIALDLAGIAVSTGSACSSGSTEPSHVLRAMGLPPNRVRGSIRVSLSCETTADDIARVIEVLPKTVERLSYRRASA